MQDSLVVAGVLWPRTRVVVMQPVEGLSDTPVMNELVCMHKRANLLGLAVAPVLQALLCRGPPSGGYRHQESNDPCRPA